MVDNLELVVLLELVTQMRSRAVGRQMEAARTSRSPAPAVTATAAPFRA